MGYISPTLAVRNMKKTLEFYQESLGFKLGMVSPDVNNPEYADLSKDGMVLMFVPAKNLNIGAEEKLGTGVNLHMRLDEDIDEYHEELKKRGVKITTDIEDEPNGSRGFTVEDFDGYKLTFSQAAKTAKICMSCGMSMSKPEDFGGENPGNIYCIHCANQNGSLKNYDEVFRSMVSFMIMFQKMDNVTAEKAIKALLAKMPAWESD